MRLKMSRSTADEDLLRLVNDGYAFLQATEHDFQRRSRSPDLDEQTEVVRVEEGLQLWTARVVVALREVFPTEREAYLFVRSVGERRGPFNGVHDRFWNQTWRVEQFVQRLDAIRLTLLAQYTDLPIGARLYVEDIDSFSKVRDVNPGAITDVLQEGRVELSEECVQIAFEQTLSVSFHRRDWGGEMNDLYTANVIVNGTRTPTAFALKGKGCRSRELTIGDCGKSGDQLVRLLDSPADLFVLQYVGPISDNVIRDLEGMIEARRASGRRCWFCVIDGQDTARVLRAYGRLPAR